jgi:hypothetical protein
VDLVLDIARDLIEVLEIVLADLGSVETRKGTKTVEVR